MYRLWGKIITDNKIVESIVIENDDKNITDNDKRESCLEEICYKFDLQKPVWLISNEKEFIRYNKTTFIQDHFIETIHFDKLEIERIDEE